LKVKLPIFISVGKLTNLAQSSQDVSLSAVLRDSIFKNTSGDEETDSPFVFRRNKTASVSNKSIVKSLFQSIRAIEI
jgi:hypothetical protein